MKDFLFLAVLVFAFLAGRIAGFHATETTRGKSGNEGLDAPAVTVGVTADGRIRLDPPEAPSEFFDSAEALRERLRTLPEGIDIIYVVPDEGGVMGELMNDPTRRVKVSFRD